MNIGKQGEALFQQRMTEIGYKVEDVSANPDYWYKDIDFLVTSGATGARKSFEVKWDSRINSTGNLYLELTNIHSKEGRGWFNFCEADFLAYGDALAQCFYIIPFAALKERVTNSQRRRYAQCGSDSTGLLVSIAEIEDLIQIL